MIIETFEVLIALFAFIFMISALFYYAAPFFEERMGCVTQVVRKYFTFIWIFTFLLVFSSLPRYLSLFMLLSNSIWFYVVHNGFPFINLMSIHLIIGIFATIFSHFLLMMNFLGDETHSFMVVVSYFCLFVWSGPILVLISLCAADDGNTETKDKKANEEEHNASRSIWNGIFTSVFQKARMYLPHSGNYQ